MDDDDRDALTSWTTFARVRLRDNAAYLTAMNAWARSVALPRYDDAATGEILHPKEGFLTRALTRIFRL